MVSYFIWNCFVSWGMHLSFHITKRGYGVAFLTIDCNVVFSTFWIISIDAAREMIKLSWCALREKKNTTKLLVYFKSFSFLTHKNPRCNPKWLQVFCLSKKVQEWQLFVSQFLVLEEKILLVCFYKNWLVTWPTILFPPHT